MIAPSLNGRDEHGGRGWGFFDPAPQGCGFPKENPHPVKNPMHPHGAGIRGYAGIPTGLVPTITKKPKDKTHNSKFQFFPFSHTFPASKHRTQLKINHNPKIQINNNKYNSVYIMSKPSHSK